MWNRLACAARNVAMVSAMAVACAQPSPGGTAPAAQPTVPGASRAAGHCCDGSADHGCPVH